MDLSSYIGNKLRYYRKENKMTQDELAKKLGLGKGTISNYESGYRTPQEHRLFELAEVLNISINDLFPPTTETKDIVGKITEISAKLESSRQQKVYNFAEHQLEEQNKVIHIHKDNSDYVTETLRGYLSAGTGELQLEEVLEEVEIPVEIIPEQHYDMLLQINGDSMLPMFQDGERIFVRKIEDTSELRSGQIGVFIIDGESYLKKAYKEDDQLRLVSLNDKYDDLIFNEVNDIEVIGTVVM